MMVNQTDTLDGYSVSIFCRFLQTIRLTFPFLQIFAHTGALTSAPRWSQLSDFIFSTKMLCALCPSSSGYHAGEIRDCQQSTAKKSAAFILFIHTSPPSPPPFFSPKHRTKNQYQHHNTANPKNPLYKKRQTEI